MKSCGNSLPLLEDGDVRHDDEDDNERDHVESDDDDDDDDDHDVDGDDFKHDSAGDVDVTMTPALISAPGCRSTSTANHPPSSRELLFESG